MNAQRSFVLQCNIHAKFVQLLSWIALRNIKTGMEMGMGMGQLFTMCAALCCWHKKHTEQQQLVQTRAKIKKEWIYGGWLKGNSSQNIKGQKSRVSQERPREWREKQFLKRSTCTNSVLFALIIPRWNGKRDASTQKCSQVSLSRMIYECFCFRTKIPQNRDFIGRHLKPKWVGNLGPVA